MCKASQTHLHEQDSQWYSRTHTSTSSKGYQLEIFPSNIDFRILDESFWVKFQGPFPHHWVLLNCIDIHKHSCFCRKLESKDLCHFHGLARITQWSSWVQSENFFGHSFQVWQIWKVGLRKNSILTNGSVEFILQFCHDSWISQKFSQSPLLSERKKSLLQNVGAVQQSSFTRSVNSLFYHWSLFTTTRSLYIQRHILLW